MRALFFFSLAEGTLFSLFRGGLSPFHHSHLRIDIPRIYLVHLNGRRARLDYGSFRADQRAENAGTLWAEAYGCSIWL